MRPFSVGVAAIAPVLLVSTALAERTVRIEPYERIDLVGLGDCANDRLALAKRGARVNAVAIAALAENMPDDGAPRVSNVVRTMSGKTIENISTDAEGRFVLADGVYYAQQIKSPIADIKNAGAGNPGAGVGATVIGAFVDEDTVWAQLDIAGMDHRNDPLPIVRSGYTGYGVRLLDQLVRDFYEVR